MTCGLTPYKNHGVLWLPYKSHRRLNDVRHLLNPRLSWYAVQPCHDARMRHSARSFVRRTDPLVAVREPLQTPLATDARGVLLY